ncbi:MAG TPA: protein translocase subunit SecF, partial [Bacilli bacterium]|nr:protein translocase subunit SecF [Bacilli bacterium]
VSLIMLLMILTYHFAGLVASLGILIYTFLTFLSFWLFGGVLTLPGIAALVIGIGMAVDSCVITFARIKDELKENVSLEGACRKGNHNSFMTIFDSNFTTLLVAFILFEFGESSVKGFATMLIISTIVIMLIMVFLTRFLLGLFVKTGLFDNKLNFFIGYKEKKEIKNVPFVKMRKIVYVYLAILIGLGIFTFAKNGLTLGIDFKGGSSITVSSNEKLNVKSLEKEIKDLGYKIYDTEIIDDYSTTIKVENSLGEDEVIKVDKLFSEDYNAKTDIGVVSNVVKKDLVKNAIISVLLACVGIILYVSLRFKFSMAFTSILALVHDVMLMVIVFSLFKLEVSSIFIAAILSIIGYSINDTIVSFDRIRESIKNTKKGEAKSKEELQELIDNSLTKVLARSIITTLTTLCPVIMLIVMGAHEIMNFNFALLVGLVAGVLSSIFIACPIWYDFEKHQIGKPKKKKWYEE